MTYGSCHSRWRVEGPHVAEPVLLGQLGELRPCARPGGLVCRTTPKSMVCLLPQMRYWLRPRLRNCPWPGRPWYSPPSTTTVPRDSTVSTCPSISNPSQAE